jgi:hypothetical protein
MCDPPSPCSADTGRHISYVRSGSGALGVDPAGNNVAD